MTAFRYVRQAGDEASAPLLIWLTSTVGPWLIL